MSNSFRLEITQRHPCLRLRIDARSYAVVEHSTHPSAFELTIDGTMYRGWRYVTGNEVYIRLGARTFIISSAAGGSSTGGAANPQHQLRADMPGVVVAVHCEVGQTVKNGDPLLTIESMKLQATLLASHQAVVECVHTAVETAFERGALLVSFTKAP
jgi:acetyl/propionyl-CoA carboxylase alpha subunit